MRCLAIFGWEMNTAIACNVRVIVMGIWYCGTVAGMDAMLLRYCGTVAHSYCGTVLHGVVLWYLCDISSMQGSVVGVGRVVSRLDQSEERMTVRRVKTKVADQTWQYQGEELCAESTLGAFAILLLLFSALCSVHLVSWWGHPMSNKGVNPDTRCTDDSTPGFTQEKCK